MYNETLLQERRSFSSRISRYVLSSARKHDVLEAYLRYNIVIPKLSIKALSSLSSSFLKLLCNIIITVVMVFTKHYYG